MKMLKQPNDDSCWATCVSVLTGIDVDIMPLTGNEQVDAIVMGLPEGVLAVPATEATIASMNLDLSNFTTLDDWERALGDTWKVESWTKWVPGKKGALMMIRLYEDGRMDGHSLVIDSDGMLYDPATGKGMDIHYTALSAACNVVVAGFATFEENA